MAATQRTRDYSVLEGAHRQAQFETASNAYVRILEHDDDDFDKRVQAEVEGHVLDHRPIMTIAGWG